MSKQLYRSRENKVISGVCGGFAEYFDIDPVIVRLICVLLFFTNGVGFIAYIVCMIIIPEAPFDHKQKYNNPYEENTNDSSINNEGYNESSNEESNQQYTYKNSYPENKDERNKMILGVALIGLGIFIFAKKLFYWFDFVNLGGIILVLIGAYIIVNGRGKSNEKK